MSDDLVKRLRFYRHGDAADRIEALEAALAKADELADEVGLRRGVLGRTPITAAADAYRAARDATR